MTTPSDLSSSMSRMGGTLPYMAPERLPGQPADPRSDLYSYGVLLFELLTGRRPYEGCDGEALVAAILTNRTPSPSEWNPLVPPALDRLVVRCLARDPAHRFPAGLRPSALAWLKWWPPSRGPPSPVWSRPGAARRHDGERGSRRRRWASPRRAWSPPGGLPPFVGRGEARVPVVGVMPLAVAGDDESLKGLAVGVADSLVGALSRMSRVNVLPRSATATLGAGGHDLRARSRVVADLLVEGTVQRREAGVEIRLTVIDAGTLRVSWSEALRSEEADTQAVQERAARGLVHALRLEPVAGKRWPSDPAHRESGGLCRLRPRAGPSLGARRPACESRVTPLPSLPALARDRRLPRHAGLGERLCARLPHDQGTGLHGQGSGRRGGGLAPRSRTAGGPAFPRGHLQGDRPARGGGRGAAPRHRAPTQQRQRLPAARGAARRGWRDRRSACDAAPGGEPAAAVLGGTTRTWASWPTRAPTSTRP